MAEKDDGGPAFPHMQQWMSPNTFKDWTTGGMSLRDYFAAKALLAVEASYRDCSGNTLLGLAGVTSDYSGGDVWELAMAKTAYRLADAMLAAREAR